MSLSSSIRHILDNRPRDFSTHIIEQTFLINLSGHHISYVLCLLIHLEDDENGAPSYPRSQDDCRLTFTICWKCVISIQIWLPRATCPSGLYTWPLLVNRYTVFGDICFQSAEWYQYGVITNTNKVMFNGNKFVSYYCFTLKTHSWCIHIFMHAFNKLSNIHL